MSTANITRRQAVDDRVMEFLERNHSAVMVTLKADGMPHVARVGVGLVDNKLWSSGTLDRVRTKHLRRDPRCTLFVWDPRSGQTWIGLDTRARIKEDDPVEDNLRLYRALAGEPGDLEEYREAMVREKRIVYEFTILNAYGQF
jgi:PPOX class probable F420-dependent enzyme